MKMQQPKKIHFKIRGTSPILMHKFNGLNEEKALNQKSESEQAEAHAYRNPNENLGVPSEWVKGCLRNYLISIAPNKGKTKARLHVAPRIQVNPYMLDLGITEYEVDKRSVPAGNVSRGGVRAFCIRPIITEWEVEGTLITTLDKTLKTLKEDFEMAGIDIGIGSNRINGYGRFEVVEFEIAK